MLTKETCLCTFHKQIFEEKAFTGVLQARKSYLQVAFAIQCSGTKAVKKRTSSGSQDLGRTQPEQQRNASQAFCLLLHCPTHSGSSHLKEERMTLKENGSENVEMEVN